MAKTTFSRGHRPHNLATVPVGTIFGRLSVIEEVEKRQGHRYFRLSCACGGTSIVAYSNLTRGHTKSCGCEKGLPRHGWAGTPTHNIWIGIRARCFNPKDTSFHNYGARGISVDPRWDSFEAFLADMGPRPPGMQLDRIDNNGAYAPGNCRWVTRSVNLRNTRRTRFVQFKGERMSVVEAAERIGISRISIGVYVHTKGGTHQQAVDYYAAKYPTPQLAAVALARLRQRARPSPRRLEGP